VYDALVKVYKKELESDPQQYLDNYFEGHQGAYSSEFQKIGDQTLAPYISNKKLKPEDIVAIMVTFSPDPEHDLTFSDLYKLALKVCKKTKGIKESYFTVEQRGEDIEDCGLGGHFHAMIVLNKDEQMGEPSRQERAILSKLKKFETTSPRFLDIKRVSLDKLPEKLDYITGKKYDEDKFNKMEMDKYWRKTQNPPAPLFWKL